MDFETLKHNCPIWHDYIYHDFVNQIADGSLPAANFCHYLKQDYLYLLHYTRIMALSIYKSDNLAHMRVGQAGVNAMLDLEIDMYLRFAVHWGMSADEVARATESPATIAYTRYLLDVAMSGSLADLYAVIAPCLMGYGEIGARLKNDGFIKDNPYQIWIDVFASDEFMRITAQNEAFVNELLADATDAQAQHYQRLFDIASRMEVGFWQMALDLS